MVNFILSLTVGFGLLNSQAIAAPTASPTAETTGDTRFSFVDWTNSIITHPETALSPQDAMKAFLDTASAPAKPMDFNHTIGCPYDLDVDVSADLCLLGGDAPGKTSEATGRPHVPGRPLSFLVYTAFQSAISMPQRAGWGSEDPNNRGMCRNIAQTAAVAVDKCILANGRVAGGTDYNVTGTKVGVMIIKNFGAFAWP
ncbi:hypothetical protein B0T09DRAFT_394064 [Sordaria sp. MPI-SDFR-AT-0083]|nr:hypothetical protein B0T09DRAFT_394064 [Sordaria sp. MPI-SDFR-AT-0083]